jgi:hypothetical protein
MAGAAAQVGAARTPKELAALIDAFEAEYVTFMDEQERPAAAKAAKRAGAKARKLSAKVDELVAEIERADDELESGAVQQAEGLKRKIREEGKKELNAMSSVSLRG